MEVIPAMGDIFARLGAVNPLVWVALALAALAGYGARKWVELLKIPEEKREKAVLLTKGASLLAVALIFFYVVLTQ
jgi:hypothetical protein